VHQLKVFDLAVYEMNDDLRCELRSRHVFPSTEAILEEPQGPDVAAAGYCGKSRVSETYSSPNEHRVFSGRVISLLCRLVLMSTICPSAAASCMTDPSRINLNWVATMSSERY
jgi:hypothetical protein